MRVKTFKAYLSDGEEPFKGVFEGLDKKVNELGDINIVSLEDRFFEYKWTKREFPDGKYGTDVHYRSNCVVRTLVYTPLNNSGGRK